MTNLELINYAIRESNAIESVYNDEAVKDSLLAWDYFSDQDSITDVRQIEFAHWLITRRQMERGERGSLRARNGIRVWVAGREGFSPEIVMDAMWQWLHELPVKNPKESHIHFEHCHPFVDGNGRTGRLLYYWQLKQMGDFKEMAVIREAEKGMYYGWFR